MTAAPVTPATETPAVEEKQLCKTSKPFQCDGDPKAKGAAKGLCPRCYQAKRRGKKPVAQLARTPDGEGDRITFRVQKDVKERVEKAAKKKRQKVNEWMRDVVTAALQSASA